MSTTHIQPNDPPNHPAYDAAIELCLKAYNSMMAAQMPLIVVTDEDEDATAEATAHSLGQGLNANRTNVATWFRAAEACGYLADDFMSLKYSTECSTEANTNNLALEDVSSLESSPSNESTSIDEESDDEVDDVAPEELAARLERRLTRRQSLYAPPQCLFEVGTPLPAAAPQLPEPISPTDADPEDFWEARCTEWRCDFPVWFQEEAFDFTIILTPPGPNDQILHEPESWVPLQTRKRLTVPHTFISDPDPERRHWYCYPCSDSAQEQVDQWCVDQCWKQGLPYGVASELVHRPVQEQVASRLHGRLGWVGDCVCFEWTRYSQFFPHHDITLLTRVPNWVKFGYDMKPGEWSEYKDNKYPGEPSDSDDEDEDEKTTTQAPARCQPAPTVVSPAPVVEVQAPPSPVEIPMLQSPRWSDLDEEELGDLPDWT